MPRERGLNYTPDADGYSFDDTGIGEAAQASFHSLTWNCARLPVFTP